MNAADILNTIYLIIFWALELLKAIGNVLLIPLYLLVGGSDLPTKEFRRFASITIHSKLNDLKKFGLTFRVWVENNTPHVQIRTPDEEADEATVTLNAISYTSVRACIAAGLQEAKRFSYAIFDTHEKGHAFIQCSTDLGIYLLDFPLTPYTRNRDYSVQMITFLQSHGFSKHVNLYLPNCYTIAPASDELTIIQANLGTDRTIATDIITKIHTDIFTTSNPPEIVIG